MFRLIKNSDILMAKTEAVINTVNCVGIMGKGIALQFKERFPDNFKSYKKACNNNEITIGKMFVYKTNIECPKFIINFPTKQHWRENSKYEYIRKGLVDLKHVIITNNIRSISIPPLGCGQGGLIYDNVLNIIHEVLSNLDIEMNLYLLNNSINSDMIKTKSKTCLQLTERRAVSIILIDEYIKQKIALSSNDFITNIECQKLFYFLQNSGYNMNLKFEKDYYGPCSNQLFHFLNNINGIFIFGYNDNKSPYSSMIRINNDKFIEITNFIKKNNINYKSILKNELELLNGFCDPYDMELLSSVHYLIKYENCKTLNEVKEKLFEWNEKKKIKFNDLYHIEIAFDTINKFIKNCNQC